MLHGRDEADRVPAADLRIEADVAVQRAEDARRPISRWLDQVHEQCAVGKRASVLGEERRLDGAAHIERVLVGEGTVSIIDVQALEAVEDEQNRRRG